MRVAVLSVFPAHSNNGFDNENDDYILRVNEVIGSNQKYLVIDMLGQGTFGQVFKAQHLATGRFSAIKVLKNRPAYLNQGLVEIQILSLVWFPFVCACLVRAR
jgi:dual specificity protein kinase YAK1